jgi:hypothetical protein
METSPTTGDVLQIMKRILVIGASGSGKSTLARRLSELLGLPYFPTDPFYWEADWKLASDEHVMRQLVNVVEHETWILDGNFEDRRELVWGRADCIIWLDYSLPTVISRVVLRNLRWLVTRQRVWSGNVMSLSRAISGICHAANSYATKKARYPGYLAAFPAITVHHFQTSRETEAWLAGLLATNTSYNQPE